MAKSGGEMQRAPDWMGAGRRRLLSVTLVLTLVSLLFALVPQIDIAVSRLFYDPALGFVERERASLEAVRLINRIATWTIVLGSIALLVLKAVAPGQALPAARKMLFVIAAFAIGPGLIVNVILKDFWGRARPREIVEFGGTASFSRAWWIGRECHLNCSFVSGEAAAAFCLVALAFVVNERWKAFTAVAAIAFAAAVSFARVAAGAHFISDILIAWLLTLLVLIALQRALLRDPPVP
jgi:membrane-associated PAP2 superfamily phosphatase